MRITSTDIYAMTAEEDANRRLEDWLKGNTPPWWVWACSLAIAALGAVAVALPIAIALHACLWRIVVG